MIVFLSLLSGADNAMQTSGKSECHKTMSCKYACKRKKASDKNNGCDKQSCSLMFACASCGFLRVERLTISRPDSFVERSVIRYTVGNVTGYSHADWKPPKTC